MTLGELSSAQGKKNLTPYKNTDYFDKTDKKRQKPTLLTSKTDEADKNRQKPTLVCWLLVSGDVWFIGTFWFKSVWKLEKLASVLVPRPFLSWGFAFWVCFATPEILPVPDRFFLRCFDVIIGSGLLSVTSGLFVIGDTEMGTDFDACYMCSRSATYGPGDGVFLNAFSSLPSVT